MNALIRILNIPSRCPFTSETNPNAIPMRGRDLLSLIVPTALKILKLYSIK